MEDAQSETAPNGAASGSARSAGEGRRVFPPPRKLSDEQEVEVTRLYAETNTPIADIAGRFGIGESSVYRVAQRHGASLRGRTTSGESGGGTRSAGSGSGRGRRSTGSATGTGRGRRGRTAASSSGAGTGSTGATTTRGRRGRPARASSSGSTSTSGTTGTRGRRGRPPGSGRQASTSSTPSGNGRRTRGRAAQGGRAAASTSGRGRYRVSFVSTQVVEASNVQEAIRAAQARGATEITGVVRER